MRSVAAQPLINAFERGEVEALLAAEIVVDHALVGAGAARDLVDAAAEQPLGGELVLRRGRESPLACGPDPGGWCAALVLAIAMQSKIAG